MAENQNDFCAGLATLAWPDLIATIAGPIGLHDNRESWLRRASQRSRLKLRTVKSLFYGEIKDPKWSVALKVIQAEQQAQVAAARLEALTLASRYESLAQGMVANADQSVDSERINRLLAMASRLRGKTGAGNDGN